MKNVAVMGANGRMGQEVVFQLSNSKELQFHSGVSRSHPNYCSTVSQLKNHEIDLVIDFSLPGGFDEIVQFCADNRIPLISGTTGISDGQKKSLELASQKIAVLWAPNMSLGVAFMSHLLRQYAAIKDFDFGIEELHHSQKKDSPSGTAIHLKQNLESAIEKPVEQVVALRGGGIFGIHKVWAMSKDETITLEHSALNRSVFAAGAVRAGEWIIDQPKGLYQLNNVLGL